ncbi:SPFH domain-containing protein [Streptacidiphilus rugosus]|uniref:SPFH domain-containing protein n=1 Tax=Streptacidiphilus rugosus TaxID=405783 RepID=UPI00056C989A|nr:SPFH domain-containing protein [Streptacidiphilus rugosus]
MADIVRRPFVSHFRGSPTDHVVHLRRGRMVHQGPGQAFWFRPLTAVLAEVPIDDRELPLLFHTRTSDFQDVTVQASVTYRFTDPGLATTRLDFAIDPASGRWRGAPLEQVATLLTELAQQQAIGLVATLDLNAALATGTAAIQARISEGLAADSRLAETGIGVVGVRVVAVKPEAEVERALRTPARELIAQEADRAGFERRALAVERERAISENELQSRIELAIREEQLVTQQGANERRRAQEAAEAARIATEAEAERTRTTRDAEAAGIRAVGAAEAETEAARFATYAGVEPRLLLALALRELAGQLPEIGTVNLTPDLVTSALARLAGPNGG